MRSLVWTLLLLASIGAPGCKRPSRATDVAATAAAKAKAATAHIPDSLAKMLEETTKAGPVIPPDDQARVKEMPGIAIKLIASAIDNGRIGSAKHLKALLDLDLKGTQLELALRDNCLLCHSNPAEQDERTLFVAGPAAGKARSHMRLADVVADVHFRSGLSCAGCHGGTPSNTEMVDEIYSRWPDDETRKKDRSWVPAFCARCHADPAFMRRFNPGLPTDQLAKYKTSQHGKVLLEEHDSRAAECTSCHGVHGIRGPESPESKVNPRNVPGTCGACHADPKRMAGFKTADGAPLPTNQLALYTKSVHGIALLQRGDTGAPACNDCHGNHAAMPPDVAAVSQVCRNCHAGNAAAFDSSKHKQAFAAHGWPECDKCHGNHSIQKPTDALIGATPGTLCHDCHSKYSTHNPRCDEVAAHFRTTIDKLANSDTYFHEVDDVLAAKGLDVEPLETATDVLNDALRQTRARIHTFDRSSFDAAAEVGLKAVEKGNQSIAAARTEASFRLRGLLVAIAIMVLLALALYLKLRQVESRRRS